MNALELLDEPAKDGLPARSGYIDHRFLRRARVVRNEFQRLGKPIHASVHDYPDPASRHSLGTQKLPDGQLGLEQRCERPLRAAAAGEPEFRLDAASLPLLLARPAELRPDRRTRGSERLDTVGLTWNSMAGTPAALCATPAPLLAASAARSSQPGIDLSTNVRMMSSAEITVGAFLRLPDARGFPPRDKPRCTTPVRCRK